MRDGRTIPGDTLDLQARASDPARSAWVSAHAGSGKTHVLSRRVVRLLLGGTDPSRILCLTYTRAAAANMANRVFRDLARWALLPDAELGAAIAGIEDRAPDAEKLRRARRLFAEALETPGGLKIQTIHAFCEAVLHQFPIEANIAGHFELLDGQMETALVAECRRELLFDIGGGADPALAEAFATVLQHGGETGLDSLLREIVAKRDALRDFIDRIEPVEDALPLLKRAFGFSGDETAETLAGSVWPDAYFGEALARTLAARGAAAGRSTAQDFAERLAAACAAAPGTPRLKALCAAFLTGKPGRWQARSTRNVMAKGVAEHFPGFEEEFARLAEALDECAGRIALLAMVEATRAALIVADRLIGRYERAKSARGVLDFNDLIRRTVRLLARGDVGPWVRYKLDKGIDHILIDEAQDTSPDQWAVVKALAAEFFAGSGARGEVARTVFAVGDEKQSIYSFQGAEPAAFADSGREFETRVTEALGAFERVGLRHSFRSTEDVLAAVDLAFAREEVRQGLTRDPELLEHAAIRSGEPGYVELWPSIGAAAVEEPEDWTQAIDHATAPAIRLAEEIAATLAGWIEAGEIVEGTGKRLAPGDVVVLVRKRDSFVHALSRALKEKRVPVAGADRLRLPAHIAVKDLIALGRVALQPEDDLSLAALLRSPVFGLSEEALFDLAHGRPAGRSLLAALDRRAASDPVLGAIAEPLARWRNEAAYRPVFEFYAAILARDGIRARMVGRLGREAGEILDEFLSFALAAERTGAGNLESFLATLENAGPDIKREMDQTRDEVRIMTVHAAKGLEAPVVFLVDGGSAPFSAQHLPRLMPFELPGAPWGPRGFLWRVSGDLANGFSHGVGARLRQAGEEEYRRLLYVGMTRARDRLIVCGFHGAKAPSGMTWHGIVRDALLASPDTRELARPHGEGSVHRFRVTDPARGAPPQERPAEPESTLPPFPEALRRAPPATPELPRPLSPSRASVLIEEAAEPMVSTRSPVLDAGDAASAALLRGRAVHRLLEVLPGLPEDERAAAARRYLARTGSAWSEAELEGALRAVEAILADAAFRPVFSAGSRAEVSVMGKLRLGGRDRAVTGTIDRLAMGEDRVLIVDYKTGRPAPADLSEVPPAHVLQIALYRELLRPVYPGRAVAAALLFTDRPVLIDVPQAAMDEALARLGAAPDRSGLTSPFSGPTS